MLGIRYILWTKQLLSQKAFSLARSAVILQERLEYRKEDVLLDDRRMGTQTQDSHNFWRSPKHWQELKMKQEGL